MKKKLESELISIAHRILKLKGREDVNKMHAAVAELYQKLSVLKFAHENFEDDIPAIGNNSAFYNMVNKVYAQKVSDSIEIEDKLYVNMDEVEDDGIMEPVMETIKDIVAQMPEEAQKVDELVEAVVAKPQLHKQDLHEIAADFKEMPVFEPADTANDDKQKSLNDRLKSEDLVVGLNDKIAFIKHLFNGDDAIYNKVLSQLNTSGSFEEASNFISTIIKPDFNHWDGKEEYEERFMAIIENKFN